MSFNIRDNFSNLTHTIGKNNYSHPNILPIGKVMGVVTTQNTPTEKQFKRAGGFNGIGTIFYKDYPKYKNITASIDDTFLDECTMALPLNSDNIPGVNELVQISYLASPSSQVSTTGGGIYYSDSIPIFNNTQQNAILINKDESLGLDFPNNPNVKKLLSFSGDRIIQGRQGSAIRFSTTKIEARNDNEWSSAGSKEDPIIILTNGFSSEKGEKTGIEKINSDLSSIYLTSGQKLPLKPDKKGILNPLTNPIEVSNYVSPQIILNSDRIVINSKRDEVMIFAKTNIELNTKNVIALNADTLAHLNSNQVLLGSLNTNLDSQPILVSYTVLTALIKIHNALTELAGYLNPVTATKEGAPIPNLNNAGKSLFLDMKDLADIIEPDRLFNEKVYIAI